MFKWMCVKLAECFNAHLTDEDQRFNEAVADLRNAAKAFNAAAKKVGKFPGNSTWIYTWKGYGRPDMNTAKYFRINNIEADLVRRRSA